MAVLTPITRPLESTSGPPEFPGLSAASVWITSCISRPEPARKVRPRAEITPVVTLFEYPSGLPMAMATCPTRSAAESPNSTKGSAAGGADAQHGEVRVGIAADQIGFDAGLFVQAHDQPLGAVHDMTVGEQIAVGREQESRTARVPRIARRAAGAALRDLDEGDGRSDALQGADHGAGIGIEDRRVIARRRSSSSLDAKRGVSTVSSG